MYQTEIFPNRTIAQSLRQQIIEKEVAVSIQVNNMGIILLSQTPDIIAFDSCLEVGDEVWMIADSAPISLGMPILLTLSSSDLLAYWLSFSLLNDNPLYFSILNLAYEDLRGVS